MFHKKKIITASLLSFGLLTGSGFAGNSTALAAPPVTHEESPEYKDVSSTLQSILRDKIFSINRNSSWIEKEKFRNAAKVTTVTCYNCGMHGLPDTTTDTYKIHLITLLKELKVNPNIINKINKLTKKEKEMLMKEVCQQPLEQIYNTIYPYQYFHTIKFKFKI